MTSYAPEYELQFYQDDDTTAWGNPWTSYPSGTRPYLDAGSVQWRQERIDTLTGESRIGEVAVRILDPRAGTSNADRILTETWGDSKGRPNYNGRRARLRWRENSASAWRILKDGRVMTIGLETRQWWQIHIADDRVGLLLRMFGGLRFAYDYMQRFDAGTAPSYAAPGSLFPAGPLVNYRTGSDAVDGHDGTIDVVSGDTYIDGGSGNILARVDALREQAKATRKIGETRVIRDLMVRVKESPGTAIRYYFIDAEQNYDWVTRIRLVEGQGDEADAFFADSTTVKFWIMPYAEGVFHWRAHPATFLRDALDGEFGPFDSSGAPARSFRYDATRLTELEAEAYPTLRDRPTKAWRTGDYFRETLRGWALSVNEDSEIYVVDYKHPSSLPSTTLPTATDPVPNSPPWDNPGLEAIAKLTFGMIQEQKTPVGDDSPDRIAEAEAPYTVILSDTYGRVTDQEVSIPARAHRVGKLERDDAVREWLAHYARFIGNQYDRGPQKVPARVRLADADSLGLHVGMHVQADLDWVPNPATQLRGGTRVYQIETFQPRGPVVHLGLKDIGTNAFATAGTLTALAKSTSYPWGTVDATVSVPDGVRVEFETAVTATSVGTRPSASSALWTPRGATPLNDSGAASSEVVNLTGHDPSSRVWVRFRSLAPDYLAGTWRYPTDDSLGADYIDLDARPEIYAATASPDDTEGVVTVEIDQVSDDCQGVRITYGTAATNLSGGPVDVDVSSGSGMATITPPSYATQLYLQLEPYTAYPIGGSAGPPLLLQTDVPPATLRTAITGFAFEENTDLAWSAGDVIYRLRVRCSVGPRTRGLAVSQGATSYEDVEVTDAHRAAGAIDFLILSASTSLEIAFSRSTAYDITVTPYDDWASGAVAGTAGTSDTQTARYDTSIPDPASSQDPVSLAYFQANSGSGGATDHGALTGLGDDDHSQYVHTSTARTISAVHTFNPVVAGAPFTLGLNAQGQLVTGLNADRLDGQHGSYYRNAGNLNAGTLPDARVAQSNVTQHQAALSIAFSQITGAVDADTLNGQLPSYYLDAGNLTNAVGVTHGGTGLTSVAAGGVLWSDGTGALNVAASTAGTLYLQNAAGVISWAAAPGSNFDDTPPAAGRFYVATGATAGDHGWSGFAIETAALAAGFLKKAASGDATWESITTGDLPTIPASKISGGTLAGSSDFDFPANMSIPSNSRLELNGAGGNVYLRYNTTTSRIEFVVAGVVEAAVGADGIHASQGQADL